MPTISLHLFTNCTVLAPSTGTIRRTYESFAEVFAPLKPTVWYDPHPNRGMSNKYLANLKNHFDNIHITRSLSDGYTQAIRRSSSDMLFMLEHDWILHRDGITHSLDDIMEAMETGGIYHFRFNRFPNYPRPHTRMWDHTLEPVHTTLSDGRVLDYCITPCCSNNPHILNRKKGLEHIKSGLIRCMSGSRGIEEIISRNKYTYGAIYGGMGYEPTVTHLDGRGRRK